MTTNTVFRVEVRPKPGQADPVGEAAHKRAMSLDLPSEPTKIDSAAIYLIQGNINQQQLKQLADQLLADAVIDRATIGSDPQTSEALIEIHPLPGICFWLSGVDRGVPEIWFRIVVHPPLYEWRSTFSGGR